MPCQWLYKVEVVRDSEVVVRDQAPSSFLGHHLPPSTLDAGTMATSIQRAVSQTTPAPKDKEFGWALAEWATSNYGKPQRSVTSLPTITADRSLTNPRARAKGGPFHQPRYRQLYLPHRSCPVICVSQTVPHCSRLGGEEGQQRGFWNSRFLVRYSSPLMVCSLPCYLCKLGPR